MNKPMMKDVEYTKCTEWDAWDGLTYFWRADLRGKTIATMCRTKKECMEEARAYIKRIR